MATQDEATRLLKQAQLALDRMRVAFLRYRYFPPKVCAFFGQLLQRLLIIAHWQVPTMGTDGVVILANPQFTLACTPLQRASVGLHEIMHCAGGHMKRGRDLGTGVDDPLWQTATDLEINQTIRACGGDLPGSPHYPENFSFDPWLSAEEYYALLKQQQQQQPQPQPPPPDGGGGAGDDDQQQDKQDGDGDEDKDEDGDQDDDSDGDTPQPDAGPPPSCGEVYKPGQLAQKVGIKAPAPTQMEHQWRVAVAQAAQAVDKMPGDMPGGLKHWIEQMLNPSVPWQRELDEFVQHTARDDYSWSHPNRRYMAQGFYLPSLRSDKLPILGILNDTSGSIGQAQQSQFLAEIMSICELSPTKLVIGHHHTGVYLTETWEPGDPTYVLPDIKIGGTSHAECFDALLKEEPMIEGFICLTDCFTTYPDNAPHVPTIWAVLDNDDPKPPFGRVVKVHLAEAGR